MWVTIYTDASFDGKNASWAAWIRSENGRIVRSEPTPAGKVDDSNSAEMFAAWAAITLALRAWPDIVGIQLNSDNMTVCTSLYPWSKASKRESIRKIQDAIREALKVSGIKIRCKHVKGHQSPSNTRFWINNRCDAMAAKKRIRLK